MKFTFSNKMKLKIFKSKMIHILNCSCYMNNLLLLLKLYTDTGLKLKIIDFMEQLLGKN